MRIRETVWKGDRGEGSVFFFVDSTTRRKIAANLYISYRAQGREVLVSAKTDDLADAKRELKRLTRNRENSREGKEPLSTPKTERVTVGDLLDANLRRAQERKLIDLNSVRSKTKILKEKLGSVRAIDFRPEHVERYRAARRGSEPATICRDLEVLRKAFRYAVERGVLRYAPFIEMPAVDNVSEREFPPERVEELLKRLRVRDEVLADLVEFMSLTSRRPEGLRKLTWSLLDLEAWTLTIPPEKKGNAVLIGLSGSLRRILERRLQARQLGCDLIFHRDGAHMGEDKDRGIFETVCKEMELPYGRKTGLTIYSVKSTAVGLMHDAGLSDAEIMDRGGWKTANMMRRYRKQNPERAHASSLKLEEHLAGRKQKAEASSQNISQFPQGNGGSVWESNPPVPDKPRRRRI